MSHTKFPVATAALAASMSLGLAVAGCDDAPTSTASTAAASGGTAAAVVPKVDDAVKNKAAELEALVKNASFPRAEQKKENAQAFVYLAATSKKPEVVTASLKGMAYTYTSYEKAKDKILADAKYHEIVRSKLDDKDPKVQAAAMAAAANSVTGKHPDEATVKKIVELASDHEKPEGRFAAIEQLWKVPDLDKDDAKLAPLIKAIDAEEPWLVSRALFRLKGKLSRYGKKDEVQTKLTALLKHADPGVRGRAADALASLAGPDKVKRAEIAKLIMPLLDDENSYAKSAACGALSWLRYQPAIHGIIKLVADDTKNTYDIRKFNELNGKSGWVHHDGSAWSKVGDAALYALKSLSHETKEKFDYKVDAKKVDDDLKKAAADAEAWYAKVKGDVPKE